MFVRTRVLLTLIVLARVCFMIGNRGYNGCSAANVANISDRGHGNNGRCSVS